MIFVLKPGCYSTVQDLGRPGYRHLGVPLSGALDDESARLANLLIGNSETAAVLELTLVGGTYRLERAAVIALVGAEMAVSVDGQPLPMHRPVMLAAGSELCCGAASWGCRTYLAIGGGIDVPPILGSRSTHAVAGMGGLAGRTCCAGDQLPLGTPSPVSQRLQAALAAASGLHRDDAAANRCSTRGPRAPNWMIRPPWTRELGQPVRVLPGCELDWFDEASRQDVATATLTVHSQSDRMGLRLDGAMWRLSAPRELTSTAVTPGTIQVPPSGHPILLMRDCATTGGYPRIAHVISADLARVAQLRPHESLQLEWTTIAAAEREIAARAAYWKRLRARVTSCVESLLL